MESKDEISRGILFLFIRPTEVVAWPVLARCVWRFVRPTPVNWFFMNLPRSRISASILPYQASAST